MCKVVVEESSKLQLWSCCGLKSCFLPSLFHAFISEKHLGGEGSEGKAQRLGGTVQGEKLTASGSEVNMGI